MKIYAVDDEPLLLGALADAIRAARPEAELTCFDFPRKLLQAVKKSPCDVVFLDVSMPGIDGITLAKELIAVKPDINLIFVTGYSEYMADALALFASGYMLKPVTPEDVCTQLAHLRYPVQPEKLLQVKVHPALSIQLRGKPVCFERGKTLEMMAYLLYRQGIPVSGPELREAVFRSSADSADGNNSYFSHIKSDLIQTFASLGAEEVLDFRQRRSDAVNMELIDCHPSVEAVSQALASLYCW